MMRKIKELSKNQWVILMIGIFLGGIFTQILLPYAQDKVFGNNADVFVEFYGLNNTLNISPSSNLILNITQNNNPTNNMRVIPIKLKNYSYPENFKPYALMVSNEGNAIAENIIIKIQFGVNTTIQNFTINDPKSVKLIKGGNIGNGIVELEIDQLLPRDSQEIDFVVSGNSIHYVFASEQTQKNIGSIHFFELRFDQK